MTLNTIAIMSCLMTSYLNPRVVQECDYVKNVCIKQIKKDYEKDWSLN